MTAGDRRNQGKSPTLRPGFLWALPASMRRQLAKTKISEYIFAGYHAMVVRVARRRDENPEGRKNIVPTRLHVLTQFVRSARAPLNALIKQAAVPRISSIGVRTGHWVKARPCESTVHQSRRRGANCKITADPVPGGLYHVYRRAA